MKPLMEFFFFTLLTVERTQALGLPVRYGRTAALQESRGFLAADQHAPRPEGQPAAKRAAAAWAALVKPLVALELFPLDELTPFKGAAFWKVSNETSTETSTESGNETDEEAGKAAAKEAGNETVEEVLEGVVSGDPPVEGLTDVPAWQAYTRPAAAYVAGNLLTIAIVLTAWMSIWACACMGSSRATEMHSIKEMTGDFKPLGICACCKLRCVHMMETWCCHICMWAETAAKLGVGSFFMLLSAVLCCLVLCPGGGLVFFLLRLHTRNIIRRDLKQGTTNPNRVLSGDACHDCCVHCCCAPCAIAQEAEFVEHYDRYYPLPTEDAW